jgi:predicted Rdx family selenoprotein
MPEEREEVARVPGEGGSYEIRVRGRLTDSLLTAFEGMRASVEPVETVLHGPVRDQAALYGLLDRIQSLGLELVEVRRLPDTPGEPEITRDG